MAPVYFMKLSKEDHNRLLEGIRAGDTATIRLLYREVLPGIKKYVVRNSGNESDAEDIFQDALMVVYEKATSGDLKLTSALSTYLFAVSKHLWYNVLRRRGKVEHGADYEGLMPEADNDVLTDIGKMEVNNLYQKHFLRLDEKCRKLLNLYFSSETTETIMQLTGYTHAYVRKKKFECKQKLMNSIEKDPLYKELMGEDKYKR